MPAFFRGLLLFVVGALVGSVAVLVFAPNFSVVISRGVPSAKPVEVVATPLVPPAVPAKPADVPAPVVAKAPPVAVPVPAAPSVEAAPEPAIDFKAVAEHLILWPNTVTVKSAATVPVIVDGKKTQDLALEAGTVLQVSKVLADGSLEVRAKGAKFEIKSSLTDFSVELGKRVSELVAKGTKVESLGLSAAAPAPTASAPVAVAPAAMPAVAAAMPAAAPTVPAVPKGPLTLAQRVDILFGNKPEAPAPAAAPAASAPAATVPAATAAPVAPASAAPAAVAPTPVVEAAPAPSAEKGKDLDRKMNQLFK
jgi:pyruvate dehydrogenase E2 component (dihydrolipoamide acetyltransferase)